MTPALLDALLARRAVAAPALLATRLRDGRQLLLPGGPDHPGPDPGPAVAAEARDALARGTARLVELDGERWFLEPHPPPARLLVVGAVHIAQSLAPIATLAGLAVTVIDPRSRFLAPERLPGVTLRDEWPDEAIAALRPDRATAVVALTHDPKLDDPALSTALRSDAFFIGALGSRRSHASRLARLAGLGHEPASLARIRGPVGLPIGASAPGEIAVSIVAEIVAARRGSALGERA